MPCTLPVGEVLGRFRSPCASIQSTAPAPRAFAIPPSVPIAIEVSDAVDQGFLPLVLGGDHSIAMGTLGGMAKARGAGAVLWIDAHGDLNRPSTSPTGNVHGMPLAAALGAAGDAFASDDCPDAVGERAALVGIRSLDPGRARADRASSTSACSR